MYEIQIEYVDHNVLSAKKGVQSLDEDSVEVASMFNWVPLPWVH